VCPGAKQRSAKDEVNPQVQAARHNVRLQKSSVVGYERSRAVTPKGAVRVGQGLFFTRSHPRSIMLLLLVLSLLTFQL
jgi:hypothetical protein